MWGGTDEQASIKAIQVSLDAGINLIDTAPAYGLGMAEILVGKAIKGRRDKVVLATKCGLVWHTKQGNHFFLDWPIPMALREYLEDRELQINQLPHPRN
jgi:methylglyoxal reductase